MDLLGLVEHRDAVDGNQTLERVANDFRSSPHEYLAVTIDDRVLGVCSQGQVRDLLSGRYGFALHARALIKDHLLAGHLQFTPDIPIRMVLERALSRADESFYQDVVLVDAGQRLLGLIATRSLVGAQSRLIQHQFGLVETQRAELEEVNRSLARSLDQQMQLERQIIQREKSALQKPFTLEALESHVRRILTLHLPVVRSH